jgi:LCP family protein required for cell wall assembly
VTDRFHQPERPSPSDPRRVFVPAPPASPTDRGTKRPSAPPGPVRPPRPQRPANGARTRTLPRPERPVPTGPPGRPPDEAPAPAGPSKSWWRRLRWRRVLAITAVLLLLALLGGYLWARSVWNSIDRVDVSAVLSDGGSGTNYLIVGSDSREGLQEGDAGFDPNAGPGGQRSDTMMILHLEGGKAQMLSLPRDLYLEIADTGGDHAKLNSAYNGGPERLIKTVTGSLGIPVQRYMEVDFVSFAGLVDGLGGVTVDFENPAFDPKSGLNVTQSGPVELDGDQALAYVRSRTYTEIINGEEQVEPTGDLGRIERQQKFLRAVFSKLSDTKNPFALASAFSGVSGGLRIDDDMSMLDGFRLAWALRGIDSKTLVLPVDPDSNESGSVLILREDEAQPILDEVR